MGEPVSPPSEGGFRFMDETQKTLARLPLPRLVATSDIALVLAADGVVRDATFNDRELARRIGPDWFDRPFVDLVTVESRDKARRILATLPDDPAVWLEINHPLADGDVPVRYLAIRPESEGPLVLLGRDLGGLARLQRQLVDANVSIERDYALFRGAETQARLLFQTSTEPMLIVDAGSRRVVEVNPAAEDLLRRVGRRIVGALLDEVFAEASAEAVADCLASIRSNGQGHCASAILRLTDAPVALSGWLMRTAGAPQLLLRLAAVGAAAIAPTQDPWEALRHLPEPMLATSSSLDILDANDAFLDLVEVATVNQVRDESLSRFVGRHGVDVDVLSARLQEAGSIRRYPTVLRGQYGAAHEVEVSAASIDQDDARVHAFLFRAMASERASAGEARKPLRPVSEMTDLVGRVPLRDIVREATDIIEELCIEAALDVTQDNRASAAEMLGLSRQSLYSKLRRYGLGDLPGDATNAT